jgi:hypothetical protein
LAAADLAVETDFLLAWQLQPTLRHLAECVKGGRKTKKKGGGGGSRDKTVGRRWVKALALCEETRK